MEDMTRMRSILKTIIVSSIIFISIWGCSDTESPVVSDELFTLGRFPLSIGSRWVYSIRDSLSDYIDTVVVTADYSEVIIDFESVFHLEYRFLNKADTDAVQIVGDSVNYFDSVGGALNRRLVFPIDLNSEWAYSGIYGYKVSNVIAEDEISVPAGGFTAFTIETILSPVIMDLIDNSNIWVTPDIGIVKMELITGFRAVDRYEIWELVEYQFGERR